MKHLMNTLVVLIATAVCSMEAYPQCSNCSVTGGNEYEVYGTEIWDQNNAPPPGNPLNKNIEVFGTLIIDGLTLELKPTGQITVFESGELYIKNNSTIKLASNCVSCSNPYWHKIEVYGTSSISQKYSGGALNKTDHGYIEIRNSTIQDAQYGISSIYGGIIYLINNDFINNIRSVNISDYFDPDNPDTNVCRVKENLFKWTTGGYASIIGEVASNSDFDYPHFVELRHISGVVLAGNIYNNADVNSYERDKISISSSRGIGILTESASFGVARSRFNGNFNEQGCPKHAQGWEDNYFKHLSWGVKAEYNSNQDAPLIRILP